MKKRFKAKRKKSIFSNVLVLFLLVIFVLFMIAINFGNINIGFNNDNLIEFITKSFNLFTDSDWGVKIDPVKFLSSYDGLVEMEVVSDSDLLEDYEMLQEVTNYVSDPYNGLDSSSPLVYLYNTHQLETYATSSFVEDEVVPNVMMASYMLREELNKVNIPTIVEEANLTDVLNTQGLSYAYSYTISRMFLESAIRNYTSLEYFIDIHRDSPSKDVTFMTLNGKNYARVLFVVGLEHSNYEENLSLANSLHNILNELYPGLSRGVYKKGGVGVNGIYNQDIDGNVVLLECGGVDNTIEEVSNTIDAFSHVFKTYLERL